MFQKILIANRGEIACRVIKTAKNMGIKTVAIYSSADQDSLHVSLADLAYCVGGAKASESYLQIENIIQVAKSCSVDAIHPGYGFLSESPEFAKRCNEEGITFIGPSVSAMQAMSSKQYAKQLLEKTNVPLTPGYHGEDQSEAELLRQAMAIGFPVLLKAADGGGGKGMRIVDSEADFSSALASAKRESQASFASDTMLIEKLIQSPRHIEVQILADKHKNVLHLYERDCSIQRRHQKIIEEAPAAAISDLLRDKITKAAVEVARTIDYEGAGTVEFLSDGDNFYFMEMNTRLQVEHPVTEMITGIDLVAWQLQIAAGSPLTLQQSDIKINGHAIECRVYAEDPENNFMPSIGQIVCLREPKQQSIRVDSGITENSEVSRYYDPMLSKVIAFGENREQARARLVQALENYHLAGIKNNLIFLKSILKTKSFINNVISTDFLNTEDLKIPKPDTLLAGFLAASLDYLLSQQKLNPILTDTFGFQVHLECSWVKHYQIADQNISIKITPQGLNNLDLEFIDPNPQGLTLSAFTPKVSAYISLDLKHNQLTFSDGKKTNNYLFKQTPQQTFIFTAQGNIEILPKAVQNTMQNDAHADSQLTAPMPGTIVAVLKKAKDQIKAGDPLIVMEAMKMEHTITAPSSGVISSIFYETGSQVQEGATLVAMEKT